MKEPTPGWVTVFIIMFQAFTTTMFADRIVKIEDSFDAQVKINQDLMSSIAELRKTNKVNDDLIDALLREKAGTTVHDY